jgi:hypothetical protein
MGGIAVNIDFEFTARSVLRRNWRSKFLAECSFSLFNYAQGTSSCMCAIQCQILYTMDGVKLWL